MTIVAEFKNLDAESRLSVCVGMQESCRLLCIGKWHMKNQSDRGRDLDGVGFGWEISRAGPRWNFVVKAGSGVVLARVQYRAVRCCELRIQG